MLSDPSEAIQSELLTRSLVASNGQKASCLDYIVINAMKCTTAFDKV
jgi:hypothetical protein